MFHFKEFKIHDYNIKMIKIMKKKIKKIKVDFEINSYIIIIFDIYIKLFFILIDNNID